MSVTRGPCHQHLGLLNQAPTVQTPLRGIVDAAENVVLFNVELVASLGVVDAGEQQIDLHARDDGLDDGHERALDSLMDGQLETGGQAQPVPDVPRSG